jgi:hypothetical protein
MVSMQRWQFSLRSLLISTAAAAVWLWLLLAIPGGAGWGSAFRVSVLAALCSFTFTTRQFGHRKQLSWPGAALVTGIVLAILLLLMAYFNSEWSNMNPWR